MKTLQFRPPGPHDPPEPEQQFFTCPACGREYDLGDYPEGIYQCDCGHEFKNETVILEDLPMDFWF